MRKKSKKELLSKKRNTMRTAVSVLLLLCMTASAAVVVVAKTKELVFEKAFYEASVTAASTMQYTKDDFPYGIDPIRREITENPLVDTYIKSHLSLTTAKPQKEGWFFALFARLTTMSWFQNLASPISRILVIEQGERKEQVIENFSDILHWDAQQSADFEARITSSLPEVAEGKFFPGHYVVDKDAQPDYVAALITERFNTEIASRYSPVLARVLPLADALTIASLLEREAYSFEDMRLIAGVIWNRLFIDMNLQIDATLQYAKADDASEPWWQQVQPKDKFIDSPFNTYQHGGLPPSPIANPSAEALLAAINPKDTDCLFYFHDADGGFHCAPTYEEHIALLKVYYGRGI